MRLFGPLHLALLIVIAALALALSVAARRQAFPSRSLRLALAYGLAVNEIIWWIFRYSHEGFRFPRNLPLQLCDVTVWTSVIASLTLIPWLVEFSYFAGIAGAAMAVLTPDLWSSWPSYPAVYFFLAHGGIIVTMAVLVFGGIAPLAKNAVWRAFAIFLLYVAFLGAFDAIFGVNYMYLCAKPESETLLNVLGPWPMYLAVSLLLTLALFWLLWLPVRAQRQRSIREQL